MVHAPEEGEGGEGERGDADTRRTGSGEIVVIPGPAADE
jgi:hypothetical protein